MGFDETSASRLVHVEPETAMERIRATPPMHLIRAMIVGILDAERRTQVHEEDNPHEGIYVLYKITYQRAVVLNHVL